MKKITLLLSLFAMTFGYAQLPTSAAPIPPVRNAVDCISIYGDSYTNISGVTINPGWGQATVTTEVSISGNNTLQYANFNYQGTDWAGNIQNISGMQYLHVDVWTNNQAPNVYVISSGAEIPHAIASVAGSWQSLDIPVSGITGDLTHAFQFKFDGGTGGTIYLDNLYFWKAPTAAGSDASLSDLQLDGATIAGFSPSALTYTDNLVVGTTTVPQITSAVSTDPSATVTITQATSIPGNATVVVVSQNGNVTNTYTVSFAATIPNASPTPSTPNAEVLSIYGDTGGYTNFWFPDYSFGSFAGTPNLGTPTAINQAIQMDFSIAGYGQGTNAITDISSYNWLHFDYFADAISTQIRFIVIGNNNGAVSEYNYELTNAGSNGTLVHGSWQSINVPLSFFEGLGFNKTQFFQYKLGTTSNLVSKTVYFDNIYFSQNPGTVLSTTSFDTSTTRIYPNPASTVLNVQSDKTISSIKIFSVLGQEVMAVQPNENLKSIDISTLVKGIYFVKITADDKESTMKLVKE